MRDHDGVDMECAAYASCGFMANVFALSSPQSALIATSMLYSHDGVVYSHVQYTPTQLTQLKAVFLSSVVDGVPST